MPCWPGPLKEDLCDDPSLISQFSFSPQETKCELSFGIVFHMVSTVCRLASSELNEKGRG